MDPRFAQVARGGGGQEGGLLPRIKSLARRARAPPQQQIGRCGCRMDILQQMTEMILTYYT